MSKKIRFKIPGDTTIQEIEEAVKRMGGISWRIVHDEEEDEE